MHHVGILYDQFMMHGQRNIKLYSVGLFIKYEYSICCIYGIIVCSRYVQIFAFVIEMFIHNLAQQLYL